MTYTEIQNEIVAKYRVTLSDGTGCWGRTHAHIKERKVCKWKRANSFSSTFTLLHEVGHIETTTAKMRRAEEEYFATAWAIDRCKEYGLKIPLSTLFRYQRYILVEKSRGIRRGAKAYPEYNLYKYAGYDVSIEEVKRQIDPKWCIEDEA